jgi:hypothetical protein
VNIKLVVGATPQHHRIRYFPSLWPHDTSDSDREPGNHLRSVSMFSQGIPLSLSLGSFGVSLVMGLDTITAQDKSTVPGRTTFVQLVLLMIDGLRSGLVILHKPPLKFLGVALVSLRTRQGWRSRLSWLRGHEEGPRNLMTAD